MKIYMKNANRTACAIANKIKQCDSLVFHEKITKEEYNWFGLTANSHQIESLVENLLEGIQNVRILVHGTIEDAYISVDWRTISTPRMTLDEGLDCSYTDDYFED